MKQIIGKIRPKKRLALLFVLVVLLLVYVTTSWPLNNTVPTQAQTPLSGCPPQDNTYRGWAKGSTVYYDYSSMPENIRGSIQSAIDKWNTANGTNGSGVTFAPADANHPATLTVHVGTYHDSGGFHPAGNTMTTGPGGIVTSSNINIDINNMGGGWFSQSAPSYQTAILKAMLHEIGHTMGITEEVHLNEDGSTCFGQNAGRSVMNAMCGINETSNNLPTDVTPCDNQSITQTTTYADPCHGDPCCGDACCGDVCCGDVCCGDPCCGDPCCGDPCCGDPCCGDPCCGNPSCGMQCYTVCTYYCWTDCTAYDDYGFCYWWENSCEMDCATQCY